MSNKCTLPHVLRWLHEENVWVPPTNNSMIKLNNFRTDTIFLLLDIRKKSRHWHVKMRESCVTVEIHFLTPPKNWLQKNCFIFCLFWPFGHLHENSEGGVQLIDQYVLPPSSESVLVKGNIIYNIICYLPWISNLTVKLIPEHRRVLIQLIV